MVGNTKVDLQENGNREMKSESRSKEVIPWRHVAECKICAHPQRDEIEQDFINWRSPASIAKQYGLRNRSSVYRHAHAKGLFAKRQRNVRAALEKIIERVRQVEVTAPAIVAAVQAYSKINAAGQWVDRSEHIDLNALFARMTQQELEAYAQNGTLPGCFTGVWLNRRPRDSAEKFSPSISIPRTSRISATGTPSRIRSTKCSSLTIWR